jgi:phosphoribosyl-AMP cyclohydrolase / phosphoribosyl-ATP pyrophosphohydrolase
VSGSSTALRFDANGLIPAVVQEAATGEVLMVAWMNAEALERTLSTGLAHFWSRSRRALWQKGETSGHRQHVEAVYADCDGDSLLLLAHQDGVACHTGSRTCFFSRVGAAATTANAPDAVGAGPGILDVVERVIQSRRAAPREGSYVSSLLAGGDARIAQKVGEEAAEVMVAALAEGSERLVAEVADLWFHTLVLMGARGLSARHVFAELGRRHRSADGAAPRAGTPSAAPED